MIQPDAKITHMMATMVRQYPEILAWLEGWEKTELDRLPVALQNTAVAQGRCQVLQELAKFAKTSPELMAQKK